MLRFSSNLITNLRTFSTVQPLKSFKKPILYERNGKKVCDFKLMEQKNSNIQSLIIVNNELNQKWLKKALDCSENVILADGGANRLFKSPYRDNEKVRCIVGDLDSVKPEVKDFYQEKGCKLEQVWDQNRNDFQKSIEKSILSGWKKIFCFGAFGGRMDHTIATMHLSTKLCKLYSELQIVLFGQHNIMYFIRPNTTYKIRISNKMDQEGCGLICFGRAESVKTKGFKWNIGPGELHDGLEWGKFLSVSNKVVGDTVQIESSSPLFMVIHLK